ncbi:hypothetical protein Q1695_011605 [Nippostrongylus brasiliensis]|nr:hypothetical protein Q1695_011605 [Nippostrongylus brasiliensis]
MFSRQHQCRFLICSLVVLTTVLVPIQSSPQRRLCGSRLTKALLGLCASFKVPTSDQIETGRRSSGDKGIVHECCLKACDEKFMRRYCEE